MSRTPLAPKSYPKYLSIIIEIRRVFRREARGMWTVRTFMLARVVVCYSEDDYLHVSAPSPSKSCFSTSNREAEETVVTNVLKACCFPVRSLRRKLFSLGVRSSRLCCCCGMIRHKIPSCCASLGDGSEEVIGADDACEVQPRSV